MGKIYVIGLGPGNIDCLTLGAVKRIISGSENFLRTENHPTVEYFKDKEVQYKSYDYLYDREENFDLVYESIVKELIAESEKGKDINYYVPGNPLVAERTVELLLEEENLDIEIISGMSFIEPMIELVEKDPVNGLKIVDGTIFNSQMVDINTDMIITQVYNRRILSDIKLVLSDIYGDEYEIYLIHAAGVKEKEKKDLIAIYELDRNDEVDVLTSIYIPKIEKINKKVFDFNDILDIMLLLRSKDGCSWDIKQTHESIRDSVIEEAYEVVDAIDRGDVDGLVEELGDLLLQVVFHSQIGFEEGEFTLYDVTSSLGNKLIYRHPHVFLEKKLEKSEEVVYNWDVLKYAKRDIHSFTDKLKDIKGLPSLMTSFKIQDRAAKVGFDWEDIKGPLDKVMEEYEEVIEAMEEFGGGAKKTEEELGDLIFAVVNLSRFLDVNPEVALNRTINKFIKRFEFIEEELSSQGKDIENSNLEEMDILWNKAKMHNIH